MIDATETPVERPKKTKEILFRQEKTTNDKRHDFRLFKESKTRVLPDIKVFRDAGYQGIKKFHEKETQN